MESQGKAPDYEVCPVVQHIRPLLDAAKRSVVFRPAELGPDDIRMEDWTRQVMSRSRTAS